MFAGFVFLGGFDYRRTRQAILQKQSVKRDDGSVLAVAWAPHVMRSAPGPSYLFPALASSSPRGEIFRIAVCRTRTRRRIPHDFLMAPHPIAYLAN